MAVLRNPFKSKSDDELVQEAAELRVEERAFRKEHARVREDAHRGLDVSLRYARERFQQKAQAARLAWGPDARSLNELMDLAATWAITQPEFADAMHASIDGPAAIGAPDFSPLTRAAVEKELERFRREIAERELELERREAARRKAEAEGDLALVEAKSAALGESVGEG
jgi:hypothetical protein